MIDWHILILSRLLANVLVTSTKSQHGGAPSSTSLRRATRSADQLQEPLGSAVFPQDGVLLQFPDDPGLRYWEAEKQKISAVTG
jgi:hypothetical protein